MACLALLPRGKFLLLLRLLENLLDNLLLLNQESADNAVLDAVAAARATVGAVDSLLGTRQLGVFTGPESRNLKGQDCQSQPRPNIPSFPISCHIDGNRSAIT